MRGRNGKNEHGVNTFNRWYNIVHSSRKYGSPRKRELIDALRSGDTIPPEYQRDIYELFAGLIEGSKKLKRGNRPRPQSGLTAILQKEYEQSLAKRVHRLKAVYSRCGVLDAYGEARAKVGLKYGVSENTLDTYCYPRTTRKAP